MDIVKQRIADLDKQAQAFPPLVKASQQLNVPAGYIALAILIVVPIVILFTMGGQILSVCFTVAYPAVRSMKALETKDDDDDDKQWLTYWVIFGVHSLLEQFFGFILEFIPFYFYIKLAMYVWMMSPQTNGALTIYGTVLRPLLLKHEKDIDEWINKVTTGATSIVSEAAKAAKDEMSKPENMMAAANLASEGQKMAAQAATDLGIEETPKPKEE